jgi:hypothetical protein
LGFGGREGIRTLDLSVANAALSQLSYAPTASGTDCRGTNYKAPLLAPVPAYLENITRGPLSAVCLGGPNKRGPKDSKHNGYPAIGDDRSECLDSLRSMLVAVDRRMGGL